MEQLLKRSQLPYNAFMEENEQTDTELIELIRKLVLGLKEQGLDVQFNITAKEHVEVEDLEQRRKITDLFKKMGMDYGRE